MPGLDGYETAQEIRSLEQLQNLKRTPIIMLTARTKPLEGQVGYALGADLYIKKPFNSEELVAIVGKALGR
jgi:DNA-binding response OmpR family regulator